MSESLARGGRTGPIDAGENVCPLCGSRLTIRQCKLLCARCGYVESCEDLFRPVAAGGVCEDSSLRRE